MPCGLEFRCNLQISYGACSLAGWEPVRELRSKEQQRKENQDSFCIEVPFDNRQDEAFFAVFDGHGANGRVVAEFVRDHLPVEIKDSFKFFQNEKQLDSCQEDSARKVDLFTSTDEIISHAYYELLESTSFLNLVRSIYAGFLNCSRALMSLNDKVDISMSGTTAVAAWFKGSFLFCSNVGDSRCIIGRQTQARKYKYISIDMTYDHKPVRTDEAYRIQRSGGRIEYWDGGVGPLRVWLAEDWFPGLAMTRSFGDLIVESIGVSSEPEVTCIRLTSSDRFCILASDGVWEFMSSQEVVYWIGRLRDKCSAQLAAEMVVEEAVKRWRKEDEVVDDTTAIVLWLDYSEGMTHPTVMESGISDSKRFTERGSSIQDNNVLLQNSVKYLWRIFSSDYNRKNDIYSMGYAPVTITDNYVLKPFSCQNIN
ncbi:Protein phosphatase 2C and cyclic nucleotide-binding/kinase domain-containing protein [Galdieria sulphuraria]|nr:Protein phosphatase 2C and cyclic nucleotide-binding/kinase domain-containing protein [Galdieria sulphuraria]